ncbi:MAG: heme ABC transporter ATP-binding protein [Flavobacteriales bacterium]|jgi:iron complex transport system ATP-binding protein|nr:heme ABC transporter ATP-binding protein [Flavobacteriales bacterium]
MLEVDGISVQVGRRGPVLLHDVRFACRPGTLLTVLGANGAGKSTLLRTIGGEMPPAAGAVRWKGEHIQRIPLGALARERAFLDQHGAVPFAFTAREVVMMGRYPHAGDVPGRADDAAVERAMRLMHVTPFQHREMPSLSGGERKRAHIARAIAQLDGATAPTLLMLDEPLNDLDVKHQHAVMKYARQQAEEGHCVLAVLHDLNMAARYAHRMLLLKHGRALACGTPRAVLTPAHLAHAYDMPAHVLPHPVDGGPWVHFGMDPLKQTRTPSGPAPQAEPARAELDITFHIP